MKQQRFKWTFVLLFLSYSLIAQETTQAVEVGLERLFNEYKEELKGKKVGLITNTSAITKKGESAFELFIRNQSCCFFELKAVFSPEHGFDAQADAFEFIKNERRGKIPVYSLHGKTKRPTESMLSGIDLLIYDLQTVGTRCYTYETTLYYAMEEASKKKLEVWVLDRPNPLGGDLVEGPILEDSFKSFFSMGNLPFCHGMTIGELALFFKQENEMGCPLKIIRMTGWNREMTFGQTGLTWKPPSPNIPYARTSFTYPATIMLGETLELVSVDRQGLYPFERIGAPWIDGQILMAALEKQCKAGVLFEVDSFIPKSEPYKGETCHGVRLKVSDPKLFKPFAMQCVLFETLESLYPHLIQEGLYRAKSKRRDVACHYISGSKDFFNFIEKKGDCRAAKLKDKQKEAYKAFFEKRKKVLLY